MDAARLDALVGGRLDGVHVTPETGLVLLTVWCPGGARRLVAGVGPRVVGVGEARATPVFHAGARHPLVAAAKARLVGRHLRRVAHDDVSLCVSVGDGDDAGALALDLSPAGEARVLDAAGATVLRWHGERLRGAPVCEPRDDDPDAGAELLRVSDGVAAELRRGALLRAVRGLARRLARRREAVEGDLARLDDVARLQRIGRLLLAQGARVPRGATRATLDDWEEGGTVEVTLDPAVPAKQQAEGWFQKARRVQRGEAQMWARLEATQRALDAARALESSLAAADTATPEALDAWRAAARALGLRDVDAAPTARPSRDAPRVPYLEYRGWRDRRILVGRGADDNDALTLRVARPQDVWLHARGVTGAHVVVPLDRGAQCPQELLLDAATLAAHHSDARGEALVEVTWTERRYVRKPRGAPPGTAVLERERVLALRLEPERLARLLRARADAVTER